MMKQLALFDLPVPIISDLNSSDQGARREALVVANLMARGLAVYPRWGAGGSPDLIIVGAKGETARVEVKSGCSKRGVRWDDADLMAVVNDKDEIAYYWYDWDYGHKRGCDPVTWFQEHAYCHIELDRRIRALEENDAMLERVFQEEMRKAGASIEPYKVYLKENDDIPEGYRIEIRATLAKVE